MISLGREIPPEGTGDIYILGEAPGQLEDRAGRAFVGSAGNLLFRTLQKFGVFRHQTRVANIFWRKPPFNDIDAIRHQYSEEFQNYVLRTQEDILQHKPKLILALGNSALQALFPELSIAKSRGFVHFWNGIPVLPTWHPSAVLRQDTLYFTFASDIQKAVKLAKGELRLYNPDKDFVLIKNNPSEFVKLTKSALEQGDTVSLDIEVNQYGDSPTMTLIGSAFRLNGKLYAVNTAPTKEVIDFLKEVSSRFARQTVWHNANYDLTWLYGQYGIEFMDIVHDTMIAHHILLPDQQKSLDFCASLYLALPQWKHEREAMPLFYNLMDVIATKLLYEELEAQLQAQGYWEVYLQKLQELEVAIFMGYLGVRLDTEKKEELRAKLLTQMSELKARMCELFPETASMNLNSPKQLKELLYERWRLPPQTVKGKVSTSDEALKKLRMKLRQKPKLEKHLKWLELYRQWKDLSSLLSKELGVEPHPWTGRVHTSYNVVGTESARWSSSAPAWCSKRSGRLLGGTNFQNRNKEFRSIYRPFRDDFLFIGADYSGAEAYIVAWRCNDEAVKTAFLEGRDIHRMTAGMLFGKSPEEVSKEERKIGKTVRHAANYGMSWKKLQLLLECTAQEAKSLLEAYHEAFPKVRLIFHEKTKALLLKERKLLDAWGLPRFFTNLRLSEDSVLREALAFYPQSTCTHTLNKALVELWRQVKDLPWIAPQFQIHDELVLIVKKDPELIKEAFSLLDKAMSIKIPIWDLDQERIEYLELRKEFKLGLNWGEMLEFKSLSDLSEILKEVL